MDHCVCVHDLFLISFSDGNSAITHKKPYKSDSELGFLVCAACC